MRTFAIVQDPSQKATDRRQPIQLTRRNLLKGTGVLMGTLAAGSTLSLLAPSKVWALELTTLNIEQGQVLLQMSKVLFPHDKLSDAVYALVVKDLDADAKEDEEKADTLRTGIQSLNYLAGGDFITTDDERRLQAVKAMEGQVFFNLVRSKCVTSLYDNQMSYAAFGYEGPSFDKGGYLMRGFQDLKWLPDPPAEASPALNLS